MALQTETPSVENANSLRGDYVASSSVLFCSPLPPLFFSKRHAAAALGISVDTLDRMIDEGAIRTTRLRKREMISRGELVRLHDLGRVHSSALTQPIGIGA